MSGNKFQIKRTGVSGRQPNTTNASNSAYIDVGELALNFSDYILYSSDGNNAIEIGANVTNQNITGTLTANGSVGSNGQVLTSNGSGIYWGEGGGALSDWTEVTANYTASNGDRILADTTANTFTITLPATPTVGDSVQIADGGNWSLNNLTIDRNGSTIEGNANNLILDVGDILVYFIYGGNGPTWQVKATLGEKGDQGETGPPGIVLSNTEPSNTELLWADTSEAGTNVLPPGGDSGQYLVKTSNADFDAQWITLETDLASIAGNVVPSAANTYDLGSASNTWKDLYLSGNSIFLGNAIITETEWDNISGGILPYDGTVSGLTANTIKEAIDETVGLTDTAYTNAVSYVDAQTTDTIEEGNTNLYFTQDRARNSLSAAGDLFYNANTGQFTVTTYKSTDFDTDFAAKDTDDLTEGNTNLYYLDSRVDAHLSAANGLTYNAGLISASQSIAVGANVNFNAVTGLSAPVNISDAVNKEYVDELAQGLRVRTAADALADFNLDATYANNILTATANGAFPEVDTITLNTVGDRLLVTAQSNAVHNGLYVLIEPGDANTAWELIRCGQCDESDEIPGSYVFISQGNTYISTGWVATVADATTFVVGVDEINWTQFSGAGTYRANNGLIEVGNIFEVDPNIAGTYLTFNAGVLNVSNTDLGTTANTTTRSITSTTGNSVVLPTANSTQAGVMSSADRTKLDGIAAGAQVGTVTSVSGTGSYGGLTLSGTVTSSGSLTLGGTPTGTWPISITGSANTLDGIDSSSFLRSDASDSASGALTLNGKVTVRQFQIDRNQTNAAIWFQESNLDTNHVLWNDYYGGPTTRGAAGSGFDGILWNTFRGIQIRGGLGGAYNLIRAVNSSGATNDHTVELYAYNAKQFETESGYALATNEMRAPIFYDSNNTGYYVDPASTSVLNILQVNAPANINGVSITGNFGQWQTHSTYTNFNSNVAYWGWNYVQGNANAPNTTSTQWYRGRFSLGSDYGLNYTSGSYWMEMTVPRFSQSGAGHLWIRTCENGSLGSWTQAGSSIIGTGTATGDYRAPIFYDSNDTGYYTNPASTSRLNSILVNTIDLPQNPVGSTYGSGATTAPPYKIAQTVGDNDGWRIYGEAASSNRVRMIFELIDDIETAGGEWTFRNKRTYSPFDATEPFIINGNGNVVASGTITASSDIRLKTDLKPIDNALNKIQQITGYTFNRIDMEDDVRQAGVIAQEVQKVLPEVVLGDEESHYSVAYGNMVALLIEGIKEQQSEIEELKEMVRSLIESKT